MPFLLSHLLHYSSPNFSVSRLNLWADPVCLPRVHRILVVVAANSRASPQYLRQPERQDRKYMCECVCVLVNECYSHNSKASHFKSFYKRNSIGKACDTVLRTPRRGPLMPEMRKLNCQNKQKILLLRNQISNKKTFPIVLSASVRTTIPGDPKSHKSLIKYFNLIRNSNRIIKIISSFRSPTLVDRICCWRSSRSRNQSSFDNHCTIHRQHSRNIVTI